MTDLEVIQQITLAKYVEGKGTLFELDCWGVIEVAYELCPSMQIKLPNRDKHKPGPLGLYRAFKKQENFYQVEEPQDFDIYLMKALVNNVPFVGHCGLMYQGRVLHAEKDLGVLFESLNSPTITSRKALIIRHASRT